MTFLRRIVRAFQDAALQYRYDEFAASDDGWLEEDSKRLNEWFASATGRKLRARLTNFALQSAVEATRQGTPYHCGVARGFAMAISAVEKHFESSLRSGNNSETQQPSSVADDLALN